MATLSDRTTWGVICSGLASVDPQEGKFEINTLPLTAANLVAQQALMDAIENAFIPLTLGVVSKRSSAIIKDVGAGYPSSVALRGAKWELKAQENGGNQRILTYTIPAADISGTHLVSGTTQANFADSDWTAFKTAFETGARSPSGQTMTLLGAKYISI